jgi:hypothetical protein
MDIELIINRLKIAFSAKNDADIAKKLHISPQSLSNWKKRKTIDWKSVFTYCEHVNLNWLLTGEGAMFKEKKQEKQPKQTRFGNKDCEFCKLKDQLIAAQSQTIELLEEKLSKCCPQQEECEKNESKAG